MQHFKFVNSCFRFLMSQQFSHFQKPIPIGSKIDRKNIQKSYVYRIQGSEMSWLGHKAKSLLKATFFIVIFTYVPEVDIQV